MSQQLDIGEQVSAMHSERNNLRQLCATQDTEIQNLYPKNEFFARDNKGLREVIECYERTIQKKDQEILDLSVELDSWKMDCDLYRADLTKMRQENEELKAKNDTSNQHLCSTKAQISRRDAQITKMIAIVRRKVATNRVMQMALKAAYKILPSLEEQATYARIVDMAKKTPNTFGINQEVAGVLKEAGLVVNWDKRSLESPIQLLEDKSVQTTNEPGIEPNNESQQCQPPTTSPVQTFDDKPGQLVNNEPDVNTDQESQKHELLESPSVKILDDKMDIITEEDVQKLQLLASA